ncbi:hypothetical protein BD626DRAFT_565830 [Schizophyllum amplum]|uniref:Uncharacterized protein n=1 Tax=Schizophyllum amplum TaxID=97359 RepID=A0A550CPN5_9AGAR|nr:hypothetical protein BD626DRAFT_565830 [Auriculariopsis ampla]
MASAQTANPPAAAAAHGLAAAVPAPALAAPVPAPAPAPAPAVNAAAPAIPAGPSEQQAAFLEALKVVAKASENYAGSSRGKNFPEVKMMSYILRWLPSDDGIDEVPESLEEITEEVKKAMRDNTYTLQEVVVAGQDPPEPAAYSKGFYNSEISQKTVPAAQGPANTNAPLYELVAFKDGQEMPVIDGGFSISFEPYNEEHHPLEVIVEDTAARERFVEAAAKAIYIERMVQTDAPGVVPRAVTFAAPALVAAAATPAAPTVVAPAAPMSTVSSLSALSEYSDSDVAPCATRSAKGKGKAEAPAPAPAPTPAPAPAHAPEPTVRRSTRVATKQAKPAAEPQPKPKKAAEPKVKKTAEPKVMKVAEPKVKKAAESKPKKVADPKPKKAVETKSKKDVEAKPRKIVAAPKAAPKEEVSKTKEAAPRATRAAAKAKGAAQEESTATADAPKPHRSTKRARDNADDAEDAAASKDLRPTKARKGANSRPIVEPTRRSSRLAQ